MTNFKDSFRKGLDAAKRSEAAQKEIDEVFTKLQEDIKFATENKIDIYRRERRSLKRFSTNFVIQLGEMEEAPIAKEEELVIAARNLKADPAVEKILARLNTRSTGYPCIISWGNIERTCHDRESLELCLSSLLEDANTAETLDILFNLPEAPTTTAP